MRQLMLRSIILAMRDYRKCETLVETHYHNETLRAAFQKRCIKLKQVEIYCQERLSRNETACQVIYVDFINKKKVA